MTTDIARAVASEDANGHSGRVRLAQFRIGRWIRSPRPFWMLLGFASVLGFWYVTVEVLQLPRFAGMPGPTAVITEWLSPNPIYGVSIYTPDYYWHIIVSLKRVFLAFVLATVIGVPLGLMFGWSKRFRAHVFPLFELTRPIPALAWVPLAIIMFKGTESPVLFVTFLPAFYATALNTMLGVQSIDETYFRAAQCLGARPAQIFRHIVLPGALPHIFTGLQISVGVAWFSLVAGEMISGQYGLGYIIYTSYTLVSYPTIVIGMITLGVVGYTSSALVRLAGSMLMRWRARELALEASR